ncbi:MAG: DUF2789 family protein [Gammaproteobacteria bacterium]
METLNHDLVSVFAQLGLDTDERAMEAFMETHQLPPTTSLEDADFWSEGQRQFIIESRAQDADWVEWVDEFDALLHKDMGG